MAVTVATAAASNFFLGVKMRKLAKADPQHRRVPFTAQGQVFKKRAQLLKPLPYPQIVDQEKTFLMPSIITEPAAI
jgi:hypothetical protein